MWFVTVGSGIDFLSINLDGDIAKCIERDELWITCIDRHRDAEVCAVTGGVVFTRIAYSQAGIDNQLAHQLQPPGFEFGVGI